MKKIRNCQNCGRNLLEREAETFLDDETLEDLFVKCLAYTTQDVAR